jgi:hypothetical protein
MAASGNGKKPVTKIIMTARRSGESVVDHEVKMCMGNGKRRPGLRRREGNKRQHMHGPAGGALFL